jgi:hypothetical protein
MPVYEYQCRNEKCPDCGWVEESFRHVSDAQKPRVCELCGTEKVKLVSACNQIWDKPIGQYGDPTKEYYHKQLDGHWVQRRKSSHRADGKPEWEFIRTVQQQKKYCREEGLEVPSDLPSEVTVSGHKGLNTNSQGNRGSWV